MFRPHTAPRSMKVPPKVFGFAFLWMSVFAAGSASAKEIGDAQLKGFGVGTAVSFPFGTLAPVADPAFGAQASFIWPVWAKRLSVGLVGGWQSQNGTSSIVIKGNVKNLTLAGRVEAILGSRNWGTVPFVGFDVGAARTTMKTTQAVVGDQDSSGPPTPTDFTTSTWSTLVVPEAGLWTSLPHGIAVRIAVSFQNVFTSQRLEFGELHTNYLTGIGTGVGVHYRFP